MDASCLLYIYLMKILNNVCLCRNRARKLLAIAMAMVMAVSGVLSAGVAAELGTMASLVVMFQLFLGGMIAIYLDELLQKGYGLLSGVSLFAAANCW